MSGTDSYSPLERNNTMLCTNRQLAGAGLTAAAVAALGFATAQATNNYASPSVKPMAAVSPPTLAIDLDHRCAEDSRCWSWSTMGNHARGVLVAGERRTVGPCTYRKLVLVGIVDRHAEPLRGDAWAIKHGCGDGATPAVHPTGVVEG